MTLKQVVINQVEDILQYALNVGASDIHIIGEHDGARIIFRIDGELEGWASISLKKFSEVIARIKILSKLKIDEHFIPQDGRFNLETLKVDLRVSIVPTRFVASVVLRIVSNGRDAAAPSLEKLGFSKLHRHMLEKVCNQKNGMVLITGPTGSGKTTTLHALLSMINHKARSLITIEDPIEYELAHITQIQVHERVGLTFPVALRAILRQDPDVIAIGEMRDEITATIACHAALTGHQVFSTIHTSNAIQTITRLCEMGVKPYVLASSLSCIVSQRLVHKICDQCASHKPRVDLGNDEKGACKKCLGKKVKGRIVIAEVLLITDSLRQLIRTGMGEHELSKAAINKSFEPFSVDVGNKVGEGLIQRYVVEDFV